MTHPLDLPIAEMAGRVGRGEVSADALVGESLRRIEAHKDLVRLPDVAKDGGARGRACRRRTRRAKGEPLGPKLARARAGRHQGRPLHERPTDDVRVENSRPRRQRGAGSYAR